MGFHGYHLMHLQNLGNLDSINLNFQNKTSKAKRSGEHTISSTNSMRKIVIQLIFKSYGRIFPRLYFHSRYRILCSLVSYPYIRSICHNAFECWYSVYFISVCLRTQNNGMWLPYAISRLCKSTFLSSLVSHLLL